MQEQEFQLPAIVAKELTPLQVGWLKMADMKEKTFTELIKGELEIQQLLSNITQETALATVQEKLKKAKEVYEEKKARRLFLTNTIKEKLIDKSMEFERRSEVLIGTAVGHELDLRKKASDDNKKNADLNLEKQKYAAHIKNEWTRIEAEYKIGLQKIINHYYTAALQPAAKKMSKAAQDKYFEKLKAELATFPLGAPVKFQRVLVSIEEAREIIAKAEYYDAQPDLDAAIASIADTFAMYDQDFKNKEAALKAVKEKESQVIESIKQEQEQEQSLNSLMSNTDVMVYSGGSGAKTTLKKRMVIVEENTEEWALAVLASFMSYFHQAKGALRVKTWPNLTVSQMAAALSTLEGKKFPNLTLKEEVK